MFAWKIRMKRLLLPFIVKSFLPTILLVVVSWTSFIIDPECVPGRAGVLVTLLLVLSTVSLHELDESPSQQGITPLLIWNHICLMMICLALLEYSAILLKMRFNKENKMSKLERDDLERDLDVNTKELTTNSSDVVVEKFLKRRKNSELRIKDNYRTSQSKTAYKIDRCSLYLFPLTFCIIVLIYTMYCMKF